jgi:dihydroxyacetone kinase
MARAEGISVEMVIVDDDVALKGTEPATGGVVSWHYFHSQTSGAAAAEGKSLADVAAIGRAAVESLATMAH